MSDLRHRGSGGEKGGGSDSHSDEGVLVQKPDEEGSSGSEKLPRVDSGMVVAKEEEEGSSDKAVKDEDPLGLTGGGLQHAMARAVVNKYPWVEDVFKTLVPVAAKAGEALNFIGPYAVALFELLRKVYVQLPWEVLTALFGLVLCFFGGAFVTVIAAGEAFKLCGGERVFMNMRVVYRDYQRVRLAARRHDRITKGGKLAPTDALVMAMKSVRDPERLSSSVSGIYTALLAVISTLRLQFARTITLGAAIGGMVKKPVQQYIAPSLENLLEADLRKWVPHHRADHRILHTTRRLCRRVRAAWRAALRKAYAGLPPSARPYPEDRSRCHHRDGDGVRHGRSWVLFAGLFCLPGPVPAERGVLAAHAP
eukprot:TRINITY_DN13394_c0_g1_i1.p1 TRINITY_DN13394_c0_g1~~TRINITY_DN13394_c0_g1_i1.p1  ORF type:complete len:366 (+),score=72.21 TRINITY_DN13394_c0_g1_i1:72-1169(+)